MSRNLFIIPCCAKKNIPNSITQIDLANISFHEELGVYRKKIIETLENSKTHRRNIGRKNLIISNQNIDFSKTLEARILYSNGKLYKAAKSKNWKQEQSEKVVIISALFGLVKANDYLPYYDLAMNDLLDNNFKPIDFWTGKLDNLINSMCVQNQIYDLLSSTYRKCLVNVSDHLFNPNINWVDKYGNHKGKWLLENMK